MKDNFRMIFWGTCSAIFAIICLVVACMAISESFNIFWITGFLWFIAGVILIAMVCALIVFSVCCFKAIGKDP